MKYFLAFAFWALLIFTGFYFLFIGYDAMAILIPLTGILYYYVIKVKKISIIPYQDIFVNKYKSSFIYILFFKGIKSEHERTSDYSKRSIYYYRNFSIIMLCFSIMFFIISYNTLIPELKYIKLKKSYLQNVERNHFDTYLGKTILTTLSDNNQEEKFFCKMDIKNFKNISKKNLYTLYVYPTKKLHNKRYDLVLSLFKEGMNGEYSEKNISRLTSVKQVFYIFSMIFFGVFILFSIKLHDTYEIRNNLTM